MNLPRHTIWLLLPLGLIAGLAAAGLAVPGYVSASTHRAQIEAFASALTGRHVRIGGALSLGLLPLEVKASDITITGPDDEIITAHDLVMDISFAALLHGQLAARSLTLDSPNIALPWPLPGGPKAVAPPPLLAALHAVISNGALRIGGLAFTGVSADLFTGAGGTVSISGNGALEGLPVALNLALGASDLTGAAPLTLHAAGLGAAASFEGALNAQSSLSGQARVTLPGHIAANFSLAANGTGLDASALTLSDGAASLTGSGRLAFAAPALSASLIAQNLDLDALRPQAGLWPAALPLSLSLNASNVTLGGHAYPALRLDLTRNATAATLQDATLTLPGGGTLTANGSLAAGGALIGQASLASPDLTSLLAAYGLPPEPSWPSAHLTAQIGGTFSALALRNLSGTLGPDHVTGTLILAANHAGGALAFDHLALAPLTAWASQRPPGGFSADAEITAARAEAGPVKLTNFALDGALDGTLNIRRLSANLYGGLAAGSFTLNSAGLVTSAHGFADIPSAAPLAALLPAAWAPPAPVLAQRLTLALAARGPANALATSLVLGLGNFTATAAPVLDLVHGSATGAVSLRHPEAIVALKLFGLGQGIAFPGPGSLALRADMTASASQWGLPDFVLSLGDLTATGRMVMQNGTLTGQINADTLALPAVPPDFQLPALPALSGKIGFTANRVLYARAPLLGPASGSLAFTPGGATLTLAQASLAGGALAGSLAFSTSAGAAPQLSASLQARNIDSAALALPLIFPYGLASGALTGSASLTASGYSPKIWLATLAGTAQLSAGPGALRGFSLANITGTLGRPGAASGLRQAMAYGVTPFTSLALNASFAQGNCTLTQASLTGPLGSASAMGGSFIDLYDNTLGLRLALRPAVKPPLTLTTLVLGPWDAPKHVAHLTPALGWKAAH